MELPEQDMMPLLSLGGGRQFCVARSDSPTVQDQGIL
jgi:hypothetical protein